MPKPPGLELVHFSTTREKQLKRNYIDALRKKVVESIVPETHGSFVEVVFSMPEFPGIHVSLKADRDKHEVYVLFERHDSVILPYELVCLQDEVRAQALEKTLELLKQ